MGGFLYNFWFFKSKCQCVQQVGFSLQLPGFYFLRSIVNKPYKCATQRCYIYILPPGSKKILPLHITGLCGSFSLTNATARLYAVSTGLTRIMTDHLQLIKSCLKGRAAAQKQLYEEFAPSMLGVCYRYTKSLQDAEDVLQEGFVRVFRFLNQYNFDGELGAWIRRIMVNTALNYLKKSRKYQHDLLFDHAEMHVVTSDDPEVRLHAKELAELIRQMPTGYQTIFNLYAIEGFNHIEIGQMLGISENTSRSQYMRARHLLINWINNTSDTKNKVYARK